MKDNFYSKASIKVWKTDLMKSWKEMCEHAQNIKRYSNSDQISYFSGYLVKGKMDNQYL